MIEVVESCTAGDGLLMAFLFILFPSALVWFIALMGAQDMHHNEKIRDRNTAANWRVFRWVWGVVIALGMVMGLVVYIWGSCVHTVPY